jgi:hypothetical protein
VETARFNGYQLVFDPLATAAAYARIETPGPEECACWFCRNWVAARDEVVRPEIRAWLQRFGIPSNGEIEVWEVPGISKRHAYGGWYMVVGHIDSKPEPPEREFDLQGWRLSFSAGPSYAVQAFADLAVFEIHFFTDVGLFLDEDLT